MSRDVSMKGKLIPIDLEGKTVEEKALSIVPKDKQVNVTEFYDSALDYITLELSYYFEKTSGILFEVSVIEEDYDSFMEISKNADGSYDFLTRFYNGGTYLGEMLDDGFKELSEEEEN
jgi:hypothetical protein